MTSTTAKGAKLSFYGMLVYRERYLPCPLRNPQPGNQTIEDDGITLRRRNIIRTRMVVI